MVGVIKVKSILDDTGLNTFQLVATNERLVTPAPSDDEADE